MPERGLGPRSELVAADSGPENGVGASTSLLGSVGSTSCCGFRELAGLRWAQALGGGVWTFPLGFPPQVRVCAAGVPRRAEEYRQHAHGQGAAGVPQLR